MYRYTHCRISILNFWLWFIIYSAYVSEIFTFVLVAKTLGHCFSSKTGKSIEMPAAKYEFHTKWYHWNGNAQEHALGLEPLQGIECDSLESSDSTTPLERSVIEALFSVYVHILQRHKYDVTQEMNSLPTNLSFDTYDGHYEYYTENTWHRWEDNYDYQVDIVSPGYHWLLSFSVSAYQVTHRYILLL